MYKIVRVERFSDVTFLHEIEAPDVAKVALPGHFIMVRIDDTGERIPLTVADFDRKKGTVTVVVQAVGKTTRQMMALNEGEYMLDFIGPLGLESPIEEVGKAVFIGGGLGVAPVFPQLRAYKEKGAYTISIIGFRSKELMFWEDKFKKYSDEFYVATDDGSYGIKGLVTVPLKAICENNTDIDKAIAIGPLVMMKACCEVTKPYEIPTIVSLNSIMVDGTGMCGSCRVTVNEAMKFACVEGPDFDGHKVNFPELMLRQKRFEREESEAMERYARETSALANAARTSGDPSLAVSRHRPTPEELSPLPEAIPKPPADKKKKPKNVRNLPPKKNPMPEQDAKQRATNFDEVALGYSFEAALDEAQRCIQCKKPRCIPGCPVAIDIPGFIEALARKDMKESYRVLKDANMLPAVCGRVCPQESQCEATCIVGKKIEPVAIGRLERFVADYAVGRGWDDVALAKPSGKKAAIVGSGPAGLSCAGDLAKKGVDVTVYEALHVAGGVLKYGIPEFRLPNDTIDIEVENLQKIGVKIELDKVIGKLYTIPCLMEEMGYDTIFIGTGAGMPKFMGIPGEALNGVFSANEFLTRVNLMQGFRQPLYDTPVGMGERVAVIGSGNTAMDAARVSLRMGAKDVYIVYRRSKVESPARAEELEHAIEEGVIFKWLTNPVKILGNKEGWVEGMECVEMELGEPDSSGRRRPIPKEGTNHKINVDTVIYALGTNANPIIQQTTPGLATNKWGYLETNEKLMTSVPGVFAGGDIVTGAATVIEAMGAGRTAARGMLEYMGLVAPEVKKEESKEEKK
jgi:glutamate synthase (NADPH/NADH) small chain